MPRDESQFMPQRDAVRGRVQRWVVPLAVAIGVIALLAGCMVDGPFIQRPAATPLPLPSDGTATEPSPSPATGPMPAVEQAWRDPRTWPRRFGRGKPGTSGIVELMNGPVVAMRQGEDEKRDVEKEMLDDIAKLMNSRGRGWYRGSPSLTIKGEGTGSFVFMTDKTADAKRVKGPTEPALYFKFISGGRDESGEVVRMQRTWFAYYDPVGYGPFDQTKPREGPIPGLVVVIPGMFGTPGSIVSQTVHSLRARGWAVLRMLAHPSRFTEKATFVLDESANSDQLNAMARTIADTLGDRAAECALAVEDVVPALLEQRPQLRGLRRVGIGMSGGAMVMPTVVARNPDAWSGAVLIAGGVDFLGIALESNYTDWIDAISIRGISDSGTTELSPARRRELSEAYRQVAPLDSLHTAAALRGKKVLLLHAKQDHAVPARFGEELWEAAGRPERWSYNTGHELIFMSMPLQLERLGAWLEDHVATAGTPANPESTATPTQATPPVEAK